MQKKFTPGLMCRMKRKLRIAFFNLVLFTACFVSQALAGHDIMVHLAIYNDGPFKVEKAPAVFGVPLPSYDEPINLENLILAGADSCQFRPLSYWPNGSVRWLMVEAVVNVQPSADRAVVHLTTGQQARESSNIASKLPDGFLLNTGECSFRINQADDVLLMLESVEREETPDFSIQLSHVDKSLGTLQSRKVMLENNGPVTATVAVIEAYDHEGAFYEFTRRCRVFKGQHGVTIDSAIIRLPSSNQSAAAWSDHSFVDLKRLQTRQDPSWLSKPENDTPSDLLHLASEQNSIRIKTSQVLNDKSASTLPDQIVLSRVWHEVDFAYNKHSNTMLAPHIGVAISNHTYNDTRSLGMFVPKSEESALLETEAVSIPRELAAKYAYSLLSQKILPKPSITATMDLWVSRLAGTISPAKVSQELNEQINNPFINARLFSTWHFMTGDPFLRDLYLKRISAIDPVDGYSVANTVIDLWDAYLLESSIEKRDKVVSLLEQRCQAWKDADNASPVEAFFFRLIAKVIYQGGLEEKQSDQWLDRLERLVHVHRHRHPSDILFAEGYRLTGDKALLNQGRKWLNDHEIKHIDYNAIDGLLDHIQRQYIWRWLPVETEIDSENGLRVQWKVPSNVVRYRFKQADKPITNMPDKNAGDRSLAFCEADSLDVNIPILPAGSKQIFHVSKKALTGGNFIAIRYLERGPDLPVPIAQSPKAFITQDSDNSIEPSSIINRFIWIVLVLIFGGMVFIFKKRPI